MITDINKILVEWAYRTSDGKPDAKNKAKLLTLESVLSDFGWSREARAELLNTLIKEDDIVKNRETGNIYTVKNVNKDKHQLIKKNASKDDIQKVKKTKEKEDEPKKEPEEKGVVAGNPNEGDNQVKNDMFKYGYKGYEKATGSKPAPGGAGSAFNEIMSGEGVHILKENLDMTEEELARRLYERSKDTKLGEEQKSTVGIGKKDTPSDIENSDLWSKCLVSARSAKKKFERTQTRVKRLQESKKFGEAQKTSTFYGAQSSIDAQGKW